MDSKGIEGYNQLTQILRPHRDLRGFYFGVRAVIYRMCAPKVEEDTSYSELREISIQTKGNVFYADYRPFRKEKVSRVLYIGNIRSPCLTPLNNPKPEGENELGGYFDKENYDLISIVFQDIIACIQSGVGAFKEQKIRSGSGAVSILKRVESEEEGKLVLNYRCYLLHSSGKEIASEEIRFFIEKNPKA